MLGVIDQPVLRERWVGLAGAPSTYNGRPIRTRACADIGAAYMYSTTPHMFAGATEHSWGRVRDAVRIPLYGCDCYAYGLLSMGQADLVVEADLKPYDYMALVPIIEVGGRVGACGARGWVSALGVGVWLLAGGMSPKRDAYEHRLCCWRHPCRCMCAGASSICWQIERLGSACTQNPCPPPLAAPQGAGGKVTDWEGRPLRWEVTDANFEQAISEYPGEVLAAGDARTHAQALKLLSWGSSSDSGGEQ